MVRYGDGLIAESAECVRSAKGLWDGKGWVRASGDALQYPAGTGRAEVACLIVEQQTGFRCWVLSLQPEAVGC